MRARDESALEQFYERYSPLVYAVCLRVLGQTADAEETMVEVFWEVWDKPNRYDEQRGSVVSYLMVLARSRAIDRRRAKGGQATLTLNDHDADSDRPRQPSIPATTPEPIDDAWLKEQRHRVVQGLDLLTPPQREALVLSFFHGLSHQQIAERLGEPLGTVKTRIRQAIIRLRDGLRNLEEGE
jgi:RNA polymerase sigma-70 factor (ECF subfamily)